ncbi:ATP-binding domain-containing protein [Piscinibacter sakaiensis]
MPRTAGARRPATTAWPAPGTPAARSWCCATTRCSACSTATSASRGRWRAWALTIHQSQGSEFDAVDVVLPPGPHRVLTRELLYTAVTRARHAVRLFGSAEAVDRAVQGLGPRARPRRLRVAPGASPTGGCAHARAQNTNGDVLVWGTDRFGTHPRGPQGWAASEELNRGAELQRAARRTEFRGPWHGMGHPGLRFGQEWAEAGRYGPPGGAIVRAPRHGVLRGRTARHRGRVPWMPVQFEPPAEVARSEVARSNSGAT